LDGGKSKVFLPSTVLDASTDEVSLIRLGHIPLDEIRKVVPKIRIPDEETPDCDGKEKQAVEVGTVAENRAEEDKRPQAEASG